MYDINQHSVRTVVFPRETPTGHPWSYLLLTRATRCHTCHTVAQISHATVFVLTRLRRSFLSNANASCTEANMQELPSSFLSSIRSQTLPVFFLYKYVACSHNSVAPVGNGSCSVRVSERPSRPRVGSQGDGLNWGPCTELLDEKREAGCLVSTDSVHSCHRRLRQIRDGLCQRSLGTE